MSVSYTKPSAVIFDPKRTLALAKTTLQIEIEAIEALLARIGGELDAPFVTAVDYLLQCQGRVVVSGIGKSGHIARKIAATLASTGTPAFFVHAAEASHGDLGMVAANDVFIAISYSGRAEELTAIVPLVKRLQTKFIAITGDPNSPLAKLADVHLNIYVAKEACPLNLAPTASTTATLALGDALAVAVLDAKGFQSEDFARSHPGGALGRRLLTHVYDVMRQGEAIPVVKQGCQLTHALLEMTKKGMAMTAVVDEADCLIGVFTDGDLRRLVERQHNLNDVAIGEVMHTHPQTILPNQLAIEAVTLMETHRINQLLVINNERKLVGALHIHDLTHAKVI